MLEREFWSPNRRESGRVTLKMGPWDPPFTRQEGRNAPELGRLQRDNYDGRLATIKLAKLSGHRVAIGTLLVLVSFGKRVSWRQLL